MTRKCIVLVTLLSGIFLSARCPAQQSRQALQDPEWVKTDAPKKIVYAVPGMENARIRKVAYKQVGTTALEAVFYSPESLSGHLLPAVIFIHGGPLPANLLTQPTHWGQYVSYGQLAAASGLIGVTFNHRLYGLDRFPDAESDLADLIHYIRQNGVALGIDKDHINLWAFSGGGPLLTLAMRESSPYIRCIISYYALLDPPSIRKLIPATVSDETLQNFSPFHYLTIAKERMPPIFVARAGLDYPGQNDIVDRFIQQALSKNLSINVANHPSGHHGFDIADNDARSREIIQATFAFIHAQN